MFKNILPNEAKVHTSRQTRKPSRLSTSPSLATRVKTSLRRFSMAKN